MIFLKNKDERESRIIDIENDSDDKNESQNKAQNYIQQTIARGILKVKVLERRLRKKVAFIQG